MNTARAYANVVVQGLLDGSTARDAARTFAEEYQRFQDPRERVRAEAAARAQAKRDASFKRLEKWAHDRLTRRRAKEAAQRAQIAGPGWKICPGPTPHADLERLFKETLDLAFTGTPWPPDIRVCWGELAAPNARQRTLAAYVPAARRIVVDRRHVQGQSVSDFLETALHEIVHLLYREHPRQSHGADFQRTLARALQVLNGLAAPADALAPAPTAGPLPPKNGGGALPGSAHPRPPMGQRWAGPRGFVSQPGLSPDLEYRG
jgi:hypothetical protein